MAAPFINKVRRNLTDPELTKDLVDRIFCFSHIEPDRQKLIKRCMAEVLLRVANSPSDSAVAALWEARRHLESVIVVSQPCSRMEILSRVKSDGEPESPWQIILPSLNGLDEDWIKYVLAHELAHGILKDLEVPTKELGEMVGNYTEYRADALVKSWGFTPPLKKEKKKQKKGE